MIRNNISKLLSIAVLLLTSQQGKALFPINITRPYDYNVYPRYTPNGMTGAEFGVFSEFGHKAQGRNADGTQVHPFQLWQSDNSTLAMIKGFSAESSNALEQEIAEFAQQFNVDDDDGTRGHVNINGDITLDYNVIFSARAHLPHNFTLGLYIPFVGLHTSNITIHDKTLNRTADDVLVKEKITDDLTSLVYSFGDGLRIGPWRTQGIGDMAIIGSWARDFVQRKPLLHNVRLHVDVGASIPTGKEADVDDLLAIPLGNNGATGLFFGAGIDLQLGRYVRLGVDTSFLSLLNNVVPTRVRSYFHQSDLLLLHKECALMDWGFTQQYNLYAQLYKIGDRVSARAMYQYVRHDDDGIALTSGRFSSYIAQTGAPLQGWTMHHFLLSIDYDAVERAGLKPYITAFYKVPINGRRSILFNTVGFMCAIRY